MDWFACAIIASSAKGRSGDGMRSGAESTGTPEMSNHTKDLFGKFSASKGFGDTISQSALEEQ